MMKYTGNPDHHIIGDIVTELILKEDWYDKYPLYYLGWTKDQAAKFGMEELNWLDQKYFTTSVSFYTLTIYLNMSHFIFLLFNALILKAVFYQLELLSHLIIWPYSRFCYLFFPLFWQTNNSHS